MNGGIMLFRNGKNIVHSTMFYGNYFVGNGNEGVAEVDITHINKKNPYKKSVRKSVTISPFPPHKIQGKSHYLLLYIFTP